MIFYCWLKAGGIVVFFGECGNGDNFSVHVEIMLNF